MIEANIRPQALPSPRAALIDEDAPRAPGPPASDPSRPYDLGRAFEFLRRRVPVIVASLAIGAAASIFAAYVVKPTYTATALLAVNEANVGADARASEDSVDTQIAMLQSPVFIQRAFEAIARDDRLRGSIARPIDFQRRFKVAQQLRSRLIALSFSAKSASGAAETANTVARLYVEDPLLQSVASVDDASDAFSQQIATLEAALQRVESRESDKDASSQASATGEAAQLRDQIADLKLSESLARRRKATRQQALALSPPVQLVALAQPPAHPSSLNPVYMIIAGVVSSGIFGVVLALFLGALDKRIYLPSDLIENFELPFAGAVPGRRRSALSRGPAPSVGYLRALDAVATATLLMQKTQKRTILITTADSDDDTSEFALGVAFAAARTQRRVLLIDLDTTRPSRPTPSSRELAPGPGMFDVLTGRCSPSVAIRSIPATNLDYLPSGFNGNPDGLALIANGRLKQLIADMKPGHEWVIVNGPAVLGVSETRLIAAVVDAAILVVRSGKSRFPDIRDALTTLSSSMVMGVGEIAAPEIVTVLTEATRQGLPARYRDKKAPRRPPVGATQPTHRATLSPRGEPERPKEATKTDASARAVGHDDLNRAPAA